MFTYYFIFNDLNLLINLLFKFFYFYLRIIIIKIG